ncbi:CHAD domain-containing protein [Luteimonas sp. WGS1318]|uniref:CHAD domain-containing protein n=1 Tax=Luteimonas sp. WGS1318 TaxID=3366815 RepID=UPI00372D256A
MAYRIRHRDRTAGHALRRIAREQINAALACIDDGAGDASTTIHAVRKRCKKVRGLLRLVRPALADDPAGNAAFRAIAAPLGPLRDADVLIETFEQLAKSCRTDEAALFASLRPGLDRHRTDVEASHDPDALLRDARDALDATLPDIDRWRLAHDGFAAFEDGLKTAYRRGRKAMRAARRSDDDEAFHTWRKRCKDHAFHLRLFEPVWPGPMRAQRRCADALGETLGLHHDLAVLAARLRTLPDADPAALDALTVCIDARQRTLAGRADTLGARLFAEPPRALATSWRRRYAAWRRDA